MLVPAPLPFATSAQCMHCVLHCPAQAGNPETNPDKLGAFGCAAVGEAAPKKRAAPGTGSKVRGRSHGLIGIAISCLQPALPTHVSITGCADVQAVFGCSLECRVLRSRRPRSEGQRGRRVFQGD